MKSTEAFRNELLRLGYHPVVMADKPDRVLLEYEVESGKFQGRKVRLGFVVPGDFPATAPSGPHVRPHFHPVGQPGGHPTGAVHKSDFGDEWQYWSRPYPDWALSKRTVAAYMSHVWRLWDSQ
jgi:hypothetical protein